MKIAFSGGQCTGKTTLINELKLLPQFEHYKFYSSIGGQLKKKGFKINQGGTNETQLMVMYNHFSILFKEDNIIADRGLIDGIAYTHYNFVNSKTIDEWVYDYALNLAKAYLHKYDIVFYLPNEIPLENNGERSMDEKFKRDITSCFDYYVEELKQYTNIIKLTGSVEERMNKILQSIKEI
jgi:nicotinamide riboside kinase